MANTTHAAAPMPVVIRDKNISPGLADRPNPSAPSEATTIPIATSGLWRPRLSDQMPMGMRSNTWGMAYAATTAPTKYKLAPDDCTCTGRMGT